MRKRKWCMIVFVLAFLPLRASGQDYFNLTARQVKVDSLLPLFTHSWPLGEHYADSVSTVTIAYPEFITMSADDVRRYVQISGGATPPEMPDVVSQVCVSRRKARLEISFVPIVFRDGKYQKLVSFQLKRQSRAIINEPGTRHEAQYAGRRAQRAVTTSVLASGKWAKIRVGTSGICQLTADLVRQAGFTDINRVHVYGYGGALQPEKLYASYIQETDDLQEVATCTVGGRRLFWAQGPVSWEGSERIRNPYSQYGYYFLTENDEEPLTMTEKELADLYLTTGEIANTLYEVDDFAWYHGGRNLYDARTFTIGQTRDYTVSSSGQSAEGTVTVVLTAYDTRSSSLATVSVNGTQVGTMTMGSSGEYIHAVQSKMSFKVTNLAASNTVSILQNSGGTMRLDYIAIHEGGTPVVPALGTITACVPTLVGPVANQNLHGDAAADMVIIIPESRKLQSQAERLKRFHEEHDGLRVRLVAADELYNEFSSGTPDVNAYRRYLRMLYDRAETDGDMPRFLLLFGDAAWDNRMLSADWKSCSPEDFLLCFESENSFSATNSYVSEEFFGMLDEGEGGNLLSSDRCDVAIGRFPVRTEADAKTMVDKVVSYAENRYAGCWQNEICLMGDDGNNNLHMRDADAVAQLIEKEHPEYVVKRIMWDAYERVSSATGNTYPDVTRLIKQQMQSGALVMNYCGHGAAYSFSHEMVMQLKDFADAVSVRLPLWVTASCDIMPFDGQEDNIGETTVLNKKGGGVAFYGTTRTVYAAYNRMMNLAFMHYVLTGIPIGEAVRLAKNSLVTTGQDRTTNKLQYALLGDPALCLKCPQLRAVVDDINGADGKGSRVPLVLKAGSTVTVRGHIEQDGVRQTDYDGVVTATVRDAEEEIVCRLNDTSKDGADEPFVYHDRTKVVFQGNDSIRHGLFAVRFVVPQDISYSEGTAQINLYAVNESGLKTGNGVSYDFVLGGSADTRRDTKGPDVFCYLNSENFTNGDKVNLTPYFMARISDDNGINATGNGIGHDIQLVIDGLTSQTYTLNDYFNYDFGSYTSGTVGFSIPRLTAGKHKLLFRVWDTQNNSTTKELDFEVVESLEPQFFDVECTRNPASTATSFRVIHDRTGSQMDFILDVYDLSGRHLWQHAESGVPTDDTYLINWDLTAGNGTHLSTGVYLYRIRISCDGSSYASRAKKLIILTYK